MKLRLVFTLSLLSSLNVYAEEAGKGSTVTEPVAAAEETVEAPRKKWRLFVGLFGTTANKTSYDATYAGIKIIDQTDSDKSSSGVNFGAEADLPNNWASFGLEGYTAKYKYSDGTKDDTHLGFSVLVKGYKQVENLRLWAGTGVGFLFVKTGLESQTVGTVKLDPPNGAFGLTISPRLGADLMFSETFGLGLEGAYNMAFASSKIYVTNLSNGQKTEIDYTLNRRWISYGLRALFQF